MVVKNKFLLLVSSLIAGVILILHHEALFALFAPVNDVWVHIRTHLLFEYIKNTFGVMFLTMTFSAIIGTILAYLLTCYEFRGRKIIGTLLYLPMAIPAYIGAHVFVDLLGPGGYIFNLTGGATGIDSFWTAVLVFTTFYFPYVFLTVRGFMRHGMASYIENARLLGKKEWQIFFLVILPLAKTAIATGAIFVGLEVLGDFGAVNYLNLHTFATAIFKAWFNFRDLHSALRLSGMVIVAIFGLLLLKNLLVKSKPASTSKEKVLKRRELSLGGKIGVYLLSGSVIAFSLGLPLFRLTTWSIMAWPRFRWDELPPILFNTIFYPVVATLMIIILGFIVATFVRTAPRLLGAGYGKITFISYALPGPVVAIVVIFFSLDLADIFGFAVATTAIMLLFGYVVRYLGIAYENINDGYGKLGFKYHQASRTLGKSYYRTLLAVDFPMLRPFIISAAALVFIDLVKELPLTLALRPFNFHTLATQAYQFASNQMMAASGIPSLLIIAISMCLTLILFRVKGNVK